MLADQKYGLQIIVNDERPDPKKNLTQRDRSVSSPNVCQQDTNGARITGREKGTVLDLASN